MSDSIEDIVKYYEKNVHEAQHPRSIGLFTIPEYPELEAGRGMWSAALDAILTTLRYLAPATLLTLFWGQQSFVFKILKHIDSAFRAIVFSSEEQKQEVLQWLAESGPVKVERLETVWRHGWVLCGVLDAALPGACAGHPPTRLTLKHAQAIADHYLGVEPVFSRQELESNDSLSRHQEWKLATYLDRIRQALSKLTPPVSKPVSQRTSPETSQFTLDYVAKGSGLSAAQVNNRAYFKIYPTAQQALDPGEITILIRGPKDTYGMAVMPPVLGKAQMIRQKLLGLQSKQNFTENILPITQGATYLRSYGKNNMNKTYYIPKTKYDIDINVEIRTDHAKICYTVNLEGKYEVSITSRGLNIVGSPFVITASDDIVSILEKDSFCLEDGEEIDIVDVKTDRKVVLRIVDFVTEKMLLRDNGTLEKISDDEAKILMTMESTENDIPNFESEPIREAFSKERNTINDYRKKFNTVAQKILAMNRVCKVFNDLMDKKQMKSVKKEYHVPRGQQDIPDIVNSTLNELNVNSYVLPEIRDKYIVPESITVSLRTEKSKTLDDEEVDSTVIKIDNAAISTPKPFTELDNSTSLQSESHEEQIDDNIFDDRTTPSNTNNPFLNDIYEDNFVAAKNFGTFVPSEYEKNNLQNEETRESSIKIVIDPTITQPISQHNNPFIDADMIEFQRPKTPVFKIISGAKLNRDDSGYIDRKSESESEETLANEFVNPFFVHHLQSNEHDETPVTDFIIGAPVSLPPIIRAPSPEPVLKSLIMTENDNLNTFKTKDDKLENVNVDEHSQSVFTTPAHTDLNVPEDNKKGRKSTESSTFHSLESNFTNTSTASTSSDNNFEGYHGSEQNKTPRKDIWDSAYVSIDDNNSSPDTNNNESTTLGETSSKQKFSPSDDNSVLNQEEITNMGPAERELWQTCNELKCDTNKNQEDIKPYKWEIKRPIFTPIIEESDKSMSSGIKNRSDVGMKQETETVSVAFAELNDMYQEYFPYSETSSTTVANEDNKLHSMEVESAMQTEDIRVNSASELSDVKRREEDLEGKTSEVQTNVTESVSVSQTLRDENNDFEYDTQNKDETQFGDTHSNIVLEKKRYWDERIRQIEAKSAETTTLHKKKRISSKQLKHDSLSKRRGKQMIKKILNAGGNGQVKNNSEVDRDVADANTIQIITKDSNTQSNTVERVYSDEKLVGKWKEYWDTKLEFERKIIESTLPRTKSSQNISNTKSPNPLNQSLNIIEISPGDHNESESLISNEQQPVKQELPEEVFKAFETSPKRFFGTSRKHILNKIDTFLSKPVYVNESPVAESNICHESGLVSSRISLFHNMSNTEELPWARRKCQSLYDIHKKESEKSTGFVDDKFRAEQSKSTQPVITREAEISDLISESVSLKDKRARMMRSNNDKSFGEVECPKLTPGRKTTETTDISQNAYETIMEIKNDIQTVEFKGEVLRKKSFSKSEMDIFNKVPNESTGDYLDKYKSCDELPKINVKSFISLYESVSKTTVGPSTVKRIHRTDSVDSQKKIQNVSTTSDAVQRAKVIPRAEDPSTPSSESNITTPESTPKKGWSSKDTESVSNASFETKTSDSTDIEIISNDNKETTYLSLSDIELEIIEDSPDKSCELSPARTAESAHIDYKFRFKSAKEYFQSLEELRDPNVKKCRKLNECELLLRKQSTESLENERPQKRVKKNIKSHSLPSAEISKVWSQLQESQGINADTKLVKISEKFNVEDLFTDVTEGKLSRQGSLRGIPHKKAVLEAFRSMENVADTTNITSYEFAESQLTDFAEEYKVKNAQTYLTEYPYLPTTDPSKYHSRMDTKASGLISFKELLEKRPRRNSVPDLRLNTKFTEDL